MSAPDDMNEQEMSEQAEREPAGTEIPVERIGVDALFRAHAPFVATFLHRLGTPRHEIDDLVQEVFVVAHRKGGYVRGPAQPRSWLGAIAVRVAQAGHRARRRLESPSSAAADQLSTAPDAGETIDAQRSVQRVQRALESLPISQRAAFVLFEIEGESCESIAAVWQVPVGTVYSRLHHARRKFLEEYEALSGPRGAVTRQAMGER